MKKLRSLLALILVVAMLSTFAVITTSAATPTEITNVADFADITDGEYILTEDITTNSTLSISETVTIDLNGHSIVGAQGVCPIVVYHNGSLTINDSKGTGKIEAKNASILCASSNDDANCTITINSGSFKNSSTSNDSLIALNGGTIVINGGNFESNCGDVIKTDQGGIRNLTINGGTFSTSAKKKAVLNINYSNITINGGTFSSTNAEQGLALYIENSNLYDVTINNGTFYALSSSAIELYRGNLTVNNCDASGAMFGITFDNVTNYDITLNGGKFYAWAYGCSVDELMEKLNAPEALRTTYETSFSTLQKNLSGICAKEGTDLLGLLGDNVYYYSESGINKVGDRTLYADNKTLTKAMSEAVVVVASKEIASNAKVTEGANATYALGSTDGLKVKSNIDYCWFFDGTNQIGEVLMDGETVDSSNYTSASGSTIITFKSNYLNKLKAGSHEVEIISNIGGYKVSAKTTLTIAETKSTEDTTTTTETEEVADTADNSMIGAFVALSAFAAAGYVTLKKHED